MDTQLDTRRIGIFLAFAFGIAWATGLVIYLTGGLLGGPMLVPSLGLTRAGILVATFYMGAPALAHILTRAITQEGWKDTTFRPEFGQRAWLYWILAWFLFPVLTVLGAALYFAIFPQHFDPAMGFLTARLHAATGAKALPLSPWALTGIESAAVR